MKRFKVRVIAAALALSAFAFTTGFARASEYAAGTAGYLKSATYYSDDWVINFWNSESKNMDAELAQIAEDGFNSIILVIPWREFQPGTNPIAYNTYPWDKLDRVMEAAAAQNLSVMLRVGYTWDYYGRDNVLNRFQALLYDEDMRLAWLDYVKRLYERTSAHENFCGGFITWEDFWNFTESAANFGKGAYSREMAAKVGYTDYLRERYSLEELGKLYRTRFSSYDALYLPEGNSPARAVFYEFYNHFLNQLLAESQEVFPDLSMEVRLDGDPVTQADGSVRGYMHSDTFACENASYSSTMYSIPMGQANQYERITAAQAVDMAPWMLGNIHNYNNGKGLYIDQFLFTDNTVGFEHNAQLLDEEKPVYLEAIVPVLKNMSMGYGIWTYRDYGDNKLYNAQFALGDKEWTFTGSGRVEERGGSMAAVLPSGVSVSQKIGSRNSGNAGSKGYVRFKVSSEGNSDVTVRLGNMSKSVNVTGERTVDLEFTAPSFSALTIENRGAEVWVDDISVYTFVTRGEVYEMDGEPGPCLEAVRQMNQALGTP